MRRIVIAVPAGAAQRSGNEVTAHRWASLLRELGHEVATVVVTESTELDASTVRRLGHADTLIALHARRCAAAVDRWRDRADHRPLIVALTGTDLYLDLPSDRTARTSVATADAVIVLQRAALGRVAELDAGWRSKAQVVHQSVDPAGLPLHQARFDELRVVVLAHLRRVKDPLLAAAAARLLPGDSRVVVHHAGAALDAHWRAAAEAEMADNPRYVWHGELDRLAAMRLLATATVAACTSIAEGGANVVSEALAMGVPVIGTRIGGNTGLLGPDHPGLVPVGDHEALAELLGRLDHDPGFLDALQRRTDELGSLTDPAAERSALAAVLDSATRLSAGSA